MATIHLWSIALAGGGRRPRWLCESGRFSASAARALRVVSPEVAADRLQAYRRLRGWPPEVMERFRLVPAPAVDAGAFPADLLAAG